MTTTTRAARPRVPHIGMLHVAALAAALAFVPAEAGAAAFGTNGHLIASVIGDQANRSDVGTTFLTDDATVINAEWGSGASALYIASLPAAMLVSQASATANPATALYATGNAGIEYVTLADSITFHVPVGTYAGGLSATFAGAVLGSIQAVGCTNSVPNNYCSAGSQVVDASVGGTLGSDNYHRMLNVDAGGLAADGLGEHFALTVQLVGAGAVVGAPLDVAVSVTAMLQSRGSARNTYGYPFGARESMFDADFALYFTGIGVADGVTWDSASGVFLAEPVPEPGEWALLLSGLAVIAARLRRRVRTA